MYSWRHCNRSYLTPDIPVADTCSDNQQFNSQLNLQQAACYCDCVCTALTRKLGMVYCQLHTFCVQSKQALVCAEGHHGQLHTVLCGMLRCSEAV